MDEYNMRIIRSIDPEVISGLSDEDVQEICEAIASEQSDELSPDEQANIGKMLNDRKDKPDARTSDRGDTQGGTKPSA